MASLSSFTNDIGTLLGPCFTDLASPVSMACEASWVSPRLYSSLEKACWCLFNSSIISPFWDGLFPSVACKAKLVKYSGRSGLESRFPSPASPDLGVSCPRHRNNPWIVQDVPSQSLPCWCTHGLSPWIHWLADGELLYDDTQPYVQSLEHKVSSVLSPVEIQLDMGSPLRYIYLPHHRETRHMPLQSIALLSLGENLGLGL